jgi:hypothetical protein
VVTTTLCGRGKTSDIIFYEAEVHDDLDGLEIQIGLLSSDMQDPRSNPRFLFNLFVRTFTFQSSLLEVLDTCLVRPFSSSMWIHPFNRPSLPESSASLSWCCHHH